MRFAVSLRVCISFFLAVVGAAALRADAPVYTVDFSPPWTVGQLFEVEAASHQKTRTVIASGQKVVKEHKQSSVRTMKADAVALAVHPNGGLRKALYIVRSFRVGLNEAEETPFLPKGTKIIVEQTDNGESITVDGKPAAPEQEAVIKILTANHSSKYSSQTIFGPTKPVAIGESWPINTDAFRESLAPNRPRLADGSMKLVSYEGDEAVKIVVVTGKITVSMEDASLPAGLTPKSSEIVLELDGRIPAKRADAEHRESTKTTLRIHREGKGADGQGVVFQIDGEGEDRTVLRYR